MGKIHKDGSEIVSNGIGFKLGGKPTEVKWFDKIFCFFGWHSWVWSLEKYGVCFDKIPEGAKCEYCGKPYKKARKRWTVKN